MADAMETLHDWGCTVERRDAGPAGEYVIRHPDLDEALVIPFHDLMASDVDPEAHVIAKVTDALREARS